MVATLIQAITFAPAADAAGNGRPEVIDPDRPVAGKSRTGGEPRILREGPRSPENGPRADWPTAEAVAVTLAEPTAKAGRPVQAKGLPLHLNTPSTEHAGKPLDGKINTRVLSRKQAREAGVDGLLFTLEPQSATDAGTVGASIDYADFAESYGGNYGARLTLVELPACVLRTPDAAKCRTVKPVAAVNDTEKQTLSTRAVSLSAGSPTVLAAVAEGEAKAGDYKATSLSPSATSKTDLNTGDFTWAYDMQVPDVPGGFKPTVGLSYSSGAIDGRTGTTNNQSSWVGDGFDAWPGYIERRYKPCADDGVENAKGDKPGDLCWAYDNAFITFNGKGGELVPAGVNEYKFQQDDGSRIRRLASADRGNGDNDGEYWRLTTPDGSRYYFGYHRLQGWTEGKETSDSTWTVPVFGNNAGEPCHASAFKDSWCQQAWRWNLDYAVDTHGNAIAYYYDQEKNSYGRNLEAKDNTRYTRGGSLDRIEYGLKSSSVYSAKPLAVVDFSTSERCLPKTGVTCAADTIDDKAFNWYDTPWDMNCNVGADCDQGRLSPVFFTRERLTGVTTQVLNGTVHSKVDSWALAHRWGMADVDRQLLLDSIQRTGHTATPAVTLPKTTFGYTQLQNRLDKDNDGYAPFIKSRLSTVADESGGLTSVNYSAPSCTWGALPTPRTNATRCFPQYIGGSSTDDPEQQWFNKYVTTSVTATDRTGGAPDSVTSYEYKGDAAWHFDDDDGLTKEQFKTWSQWRGYGHVRVKTGGQGGTAALKTQEDTYFLRGMHGDRAGASGDATKTVTVALADGEGDPITDHASAAGFTYRTVSYSGPDGKVLGKTVERPWAHQTASKKRAWGTIASNFTGTSHSKTWTSLDKGAGASWRTTSTTTTHDTVAGRVTQIDDAGDNSTAADNRCTRSTYATNADVNILTLPARVETVAAPCAGTVNRATGVISDVRTAYDGGAYGAIPVKGDATAIATLKKHDGTTAAYLEASVGYDGYGRSLKATDLSADVTVTAATDQLVRTARTDGRTTSTAYSPSSGFAARVTTTTPPASVKDATTAQTSITELEPLRGRPAAQVDTNAKRTELTYDALGRSAKVWLPDRKTGQTPNYEFTYFVTANKEVAVRTQTLNNGGAQIASYALYDGFLRERQTQTPGPAGGRLITDVFYDERGLTAKTFAPYYNDKPAGRDLFKPDDALSVESQTRHSYDGLGRETESRQIAGNGDGGRVLSTTTTSYGGDRTTVVPPEGAPATTTLTDARGKLTELRQHHTRSAEAAFDSTRYGYTPRGELEKVTDPGDNSWTYTYDQLGRQTKATDPDKGVTTSTYDDRGQLTSSNDAREKVPALFHLYDNLGRRTELREGSATGALRSKWVYDAVTGAKGQLAETTRYVGSAAYTSKVTQYDQLYRPIRTAVVIPAAEGALAGTYQTGTAYKPSGLVGAVSFSAAGSLPGGSNAYTYEDQTLRPVSLLGDGFQADVSYSLTGKPLQYALGSTAGGAKKTWATNTYEWGTQRLATSRVDRQDVAGVDQHNTYRYDAIGNVLSVADVSRDGTDNQCFTYDHLRRLTAAWTQNTAPCAAAPTGGRIGGPAPYWDTYTYNKTGQRVTETQHDTTGDSTKDRKRVYTYPAPGTPKAHTLTSVTTTGPTGTAKDSYGYDAAGNTETRTLSGTTQTLFWDAEGHLAKTSEPAGGGKTKTTEYLYDTGGSRLISRTPTETTLYLGHTEVTLPADASKAKATRYTDLGGGHQAIKHDDGSVTLTTADHHGTGQLAIAASTLKLTQRRTLPFGAPRGNQPASWPGTKGFVGGTDDTKSTGLTHLGAREYDPAIGRFISVDPLLETDKPQSLNGYTYAHQNPLTFTDASGLGVPECHSGEFDRCVNGSPTSKSTHHPERSTSPKASAPKTPAWKEEGGTGYDLNEDGYVELLPNVYIPDGWEGQQKFIEAFYSHLENLSYIGIDLYADYQGHAPYIDSDIKSALLNACHATSCPSKKRYMYSSAGAKLIAGVSEGVAGRGGIHGPRRDGKGGSGNCATRNSFLPGTQVVLADGATKNIEDVEIGDQVLATDPETGETTAKTVTAEINGEGIKHLVEITIDTDGEKGDSTASVTATDRHPFWVAGVKEWIDATDLRPGERLRRNDGASLRITAVARWTEGSRVHNFTVADFHTYYVLAGETPVLVHNSGGCPDLDALSQSGMRPAKGKTTHAGREYQKHMNRGDLPVVPGKQLKTAGQNLLDDILTNPQTATSAVNSGNFAGGTRYIMPDPAGGRGIGATFDANGQFQYFGRY
ncbi:polymorphic toxin-type HINT domain-containing protein [Streptomyces sp. cmx-18-6]|uniref:polymorphic toxin-type HINT domain-containing protein n=1 Tax=Streptomyces sp. cmx-18-6 TaxID=2790930 RepID=UPI00397FDBB8